MREIAAHHLRRIRAKIADLARLEQLLAAAIDQCSGEIVPECRVIDMLDDAQDRCRCL